MKTTKLFGTNGEVTFDEEESFEYTTSCGDVYCDCYKLSDDTIIAFDDSVNAYVCIGKDAMDGINKVVYCTRDSACGNIIERFETKNEAITAIDEYEKQDMLDGDFTPDFYEIVKDVIKAGDY